jgi:DNA-binding MarR family transcriptional regulator
LKPTIEVRAFEAMIAFAQKVQRAAEVALAHTGISPAQFFILDTIERRPGTQQSALAETLGVTSANVSQLVTKLEDAKLVTRLERGRAKEVHLTSRGRQLVDRLRPEHDAFLTSRFAALSRGERRTLLSLLEMLIAADPTERS